VIRHHVLIICLKHGVNFQTTELTVAETCVLCTKKLTYTSNHNDGGKQPHEDLTAWKRYRLSFQSNKEKTGYSKRLQDK